MDRVLLIDFMNLAWKANVLFKPKPQIEGYEDKQEAPVKPEAPPQNVVVYNWFRNLKPIIDQFSPHKVICVLEGHPSFRYELLPEYKANRIIKTGELTKSDISKAEAKARLQLAIPEILRLMKLLPISTMKHVAFEADDVIGSLVQDLKSEDVIVVSGDSDLTQMLQWGLANLRIYHPIRKTMAVAPSYHYLTHKVLAGDKTDGIRSIVKPAKALKLVEDPEALKEWLEATTENASLFSINKQLIELAKVNLSEVELIDGSPDYATLRLEFEQLDFKSLCAEPYWSRFCTSFQSIKLN